MKLKKNKLKAIKDLATRKNIPFSVAPEYNKDMHFQRVSETLWLYSPGIDKIVLGSTLHDLANTEYSKVSQKAGTTFQDVSQSDMHQVRIGINPYDSIDKLERLVTNTGDAYQSIQRKVRIETTQLKRLLE